MYAIDSAKKANPIANMTMSIIEMLQVLQQGLGAL